MTINTREIQFYPCGQTIGAVEFAVPERTFTGFTTKWLPEPSIFVSPVTRGSSVLGLSDHERLVFVCSRRWSSSRFVVTTTKFWFGTVLYWV
ncbi:MAG: hypothetical protein P0107_04505 [Nitrosomonas sp.]|nr:hypothetical protein [Nitrosomonas sp.]